MQQLSISVEDLIDLFSDMTQHITTKTAFVMGSVYQIAFAYKCGMLNCVEDDSTPPEDRSFIQECIDSFSSGEENGYNIITDYTDTPIH